MRVELVNLIVEKGKKAVIIDEIIEGLLSRKFDTTDLNTIADTIVKNFDNVKIFSVETIQWMNSNSEIINSTVVRMSTK